MLLIIQIITIVYKRNINTNIVYNMFILRAICTTRYCSAYNNAYANNSNVYDDNDNDNYDDDYDDYDDNNIYIYI